jgi:hypothetical protein
MDNPVSLIKNPVVESGNCRSSESYRKSAEKINPDWGWLVQRFRTVVSLVRRRGGSATRLFLGKSSVPDRVGAHKSDVSWIGSDIRPDQPQSSWISESDLSTIGMADRARQK